MQPIHLFIHVLRDVNKLEFCANSHPGVVTMMFTYHVFKQIWINSIVIVYEPYYCLNPV